MGQGCAGRQQLKGAGVLTSACARGSETGKCLWLPLCLNFFFFPTTPLHYPVSRCLGRKLERAIIVGWRVEGGGKGITKLPTAFGGGDGTKCFVILSHPLLLSTHWPIDSPRHTREHRTPCFAPRHLLVCLNCFFSKRCLL